MKDFPRRGNTAHRVSTLRPAYADVLCGLVDHPVLERFLTDLPCAPEHLDWETRPHPQPALGSARAVGARSLCAWLEANDPLFGAAVNLLFEVTGSWPAKMERVFWREVVGQPVKLMELYAEARESAEEMLFGEGRCERAGMCHSNAEHNGWEAHHAR